MDHHLNTSRRLVRRLKEGKDARRTVSEKIADWVTWNIGSIGFLFFNLVIFVVWVALNLGGITGLKPFDPFPFGLLTMVVSLEAIVLSILVLISQNRAEKIGNLRDEIDLQVDLITEREITKTLSLISLLAEKNGIDLSEDEELVGMIKPTDTSKIERELEKRVF